MQKRMLVSLVLLVLLASLYSCSTKSYLISGEILDAVGKQFVVTGLLYDRLHTQGFVTDAQYRSWATFAHKFKLGYEPAVKAWLSAQTVEDKNDATSAILSIKNELLTWWIAAQAKGGS